MPSSAKKKRVESRTDERRPAIQISIARAAEKPPKQGEQTTHTFDTSF